MDTQSHYFLSPLLFFLILHLLPSHHSISTVDLTALLDVKNSLTDFPTGHFFSTWNFTASHPCSSFTGITCNSLGRVTSLSLGTGLSNSPGLAGSLPASLSNLSELTQLILFPGIVTGPIPPQLDRLTKLRVISLANNRLTGSIPITFSSLNDLHTLDLSHNQLTGSIPPSLARLAQLKVLILAFNELSGELPDMSSQLLHLDLGSNRFTGKLPRLMPSTLRYLSLSDNLVWGPLSNGLKSLSELIYLDLSMNHFSGSIPLALFRPSLSSLLLQRNNLSGGVPKKPQIDGYEFTSSALYGEGSIVDLSHNYLTGELTDILAGVESLFLNNNRLIGIVPEVYVKSVYSGTTKTLYLQNNFISGFKLQHGMAFPDAVAVCLFYNCMVPSVGLADCPASVGTMILRPTWQCEQLKNGSPGIP